MHSFYCPDYFPDRHGSTYTFNEEESGHCVRVLRLRAGAPVQWVDGRGGLYKAVIVEAEVKGCVLQITEAMQEVGKRNYSVHVAMAPPKSIDRFEWFLEKATEIGVDEITPLLTAHSERKQVKTERCEKIVRAAVKQCLITYCPTVHPMESFDVLVRKPFEGDKFIAYCGEETKAELVQTFHPGSRALVLIGPEGDFSPEEVKLAMQHGFVPVTLGENRLRTETAGVFVCAAAALSGKLPR